MKRRLTGKIAAFLAAAMMCGSFAGCADKGEDNSIAVSDAGEDAGKENADTVDMEADTESDSAMGRYMETEIPLPEGTQMLHAGRKLSDGRLRVMVDTAEGPSVYDSSNDGAEWELLCELPEEYRESYINVAAISGEGAVFCNLSVGETDEDGVSSMGCGEISPDGEFHLITPDLDMGLFDALYMQDPVYGEEGKILFTAVGSNQIFLLDTETGEKLRVYNEEEKPVASFKKAGNDIYIFADDSVRVLDYESGEEASLDEALKNTLESREENFVEYNFYTYPILFSEGFQEGELFFCNTEGIFRYMKGGSLVEQIADGNLNSLAKPSISLMSLQALEDGSFLVFCYDDEGMRLLHYVYDADVPTTPDTEIRVYSLQENEDVQQAISMFQNQNPDYYVNLEIGMTGSDAVTASDALRTLNTEIMAGSGPDVLILDGMPMESYMEKGILEDISSQVEAVESENEMFENITGIYKRDGAVYAVPSRFKVPVIQGPKEYMDSINDLASLAETAAALREENGDIEMILSTTNIYWMIKEFYGADSAALMGTDGSLREEALTELLTVMKEVFDLNEFPDNEITYRSVMTAGDSGGYDYTSLTETYGFLTHSAMLDFCNLGDGMALAEILAINKTENMDYKLSPFSGKNVFIPSTIAGISSRCREKEGAGEFLKFLLSQDAQDTSMGGGFPVNKESFRKGLTSNDELGFGTLGWSVTDEDGTIEDVSFDVVNPSGEEQEDFLSLVESLDTPSLTDAVIEDLIQDIAGRCVSGEISVEDAVSEIQQKMSLYLAE